MEVTDYNTIVFIYALISSEKFPSHISALMSAYDCLSNLTWQSKPNKILVISYILFFISLSQKIITLFCWNYYHLYIYIYF